MPQEAPGVLVRRMGGTDEAPGEAVAPRRPRGSGLASIGKRFENASLAFSRGVSRLPGYSLQSIGIMANRIDDVFSENDKEAEEYATFQWGRAINDWADEHLGSDPRLKDDFLSNVLPEALGTSVAYIGGSLLTRRPMWFTATAGATQNAAMGYEEAIARGADEDQAFNRFLLGAGVGTTEAIPIGRMFRRLETATGGRLRQIVVNAAMEGAEEMVQEAIQTVGDNLATLATYDPDQPVFEGIVQNAQTGGAAGVVLGAVTSALLGRSMRQARVREENRGERTDQPANRPGTVMETRAPAAPEDALEVPRETLHQQRTWTGPATTRSGRSVQVKVEASQEEQVGFSGTVYTARALDPESGAVIGEVILAHNAEAGTLTAVNAEVEEQSRRKGVATTLYDAIEQLAGVQATPSTDLTDDSRAFWAQRTGTVTEEEAEQVATQLELEEQTEEAQPSATTAEEESAAEALLTEEQQAAQEPVVDVEEEATIQEAAEQQAGETDIDVLEEFGVSRGAINTVRQAYGLAEIEAPETKSWSQTFVDAVTAGHHRRAEVVAAGMLSAHAKRSPVKILTAEEIAGMHVRRAEIAEEYENKLSAAQQMLNEGDRVGAAGEQHFANALLDTLDTIDHALTLSGSETGRALAARRNMIDAYEFDAASIATRARLAKTAPLNGEEQAMVQTMADRYKAKEAEVQDLTANENILLDELNRRNAELMIQRMKTDAEYAQKIYANREKLKEELRNLGLRVNDITGLSAEAVWKIGQLALSYVHGGSVTLAEVVQKMQTALPTLTAEDIYTAIASENPKAKKAQRSEAQQRLARIKSQAKVMAELEAALRGDFKPRRTRGTAKVDPIVKQARKKLNELRNAYYASEIDQEKLTQVVDKIDEMAVALGVNVPTPANLEAAQNLLRDLKSLDTAQKKIMDLGEQLATGNFKEEAPRERRARLPQLEQAQVDLSLLKKEIKLAIQNLEPFKFSDFRAVGHSRTQAAAAALRRQLPEYVSLPRGLMATADMSYFLRQGLWLAARRPVTAAKVFVDAGRAFGSRRSAEMIDIAIKRHPLHPTRLKYGLYIAPLEMGALNAREEVFTSRLLGRIPIMKHIVARSERHMVTGLNLLRIAAFDKFVVDNSNNPSVTEEAYRAYADYVNVASGRGNMKPQTAQSMAYFFFAPRFAVSRFQTPMRFAQYMHIPSVRKEIAKDITAFVGTGLSVLVLAAMAGLEVGDDPRDSDFGKIVIGNTRIDIWGGFAQPARLVARIMLGFTDRQGITGSEFPSHILDDFDFYDIVAKFSTYKLSPAITFPVSALFGKNVIGEEQTLSESFISSVTPLFAQEVWDTVSEDGVEMGALVAAPVFLGMNVSTHEGAMRGAGIQGLLRRTGMRPRPPRYPEDWELSEEQKEEYDEMHATILAQNIGMSRSYLDNLRGEELKEEMRLIVQQSMLEFKQAIGIPTP